MNYIDPLKLIRDIDNAIEKQNSGDASLTICKLLQKYAPKSSDYWYEVACELHRRELFYDSLDCWREAENFLDNEDSPEFWFKDFIGTLHNSYIQSDDSFFLEEAFYAAERLVKIEESEESLNLKLKTFQFVDRDMEDILHLVEEILDKGFSVQESVFIDAELADYVGDEIKSYFDLFVYYLFSENISKAFKIWVKAIQDKNLLSIEDDFCRLIWHLNWFAEYKKYSKEKFLPDTL